MAELSRNIRDIKFILYGNSEAEPVAEACAQLTQEFFRQDTLRLFITSLPILNLEVTNHSFFFFPISTLRFLLRKKSCFLFFVCLY